MSSKLEAFFAAYFNQDWPEEYASADEAVSDFLSEKRSESELRAISGEIEKLLAENLSEDEMERVLLSRYQCYYSPTSDGLSVSQWLEGVQARLNRAMVAR